MQRKITPIEKKSELYWMIFNISFYFIETKHANWMPLKQFISSVLSLLFLNLYIDCTLKRKELKFTLNYAQNCSLLLSQEKLSILSSLFFPSTVDSLIFNYFNYYTIKVNMISSNVLIQNSRSATKKCFVDGNRYINN